MGSRAAAFVHQVGELFEGVYPGAVVFGLAKGEHVS